MLPETKIDNEDIRTTSSRKRSSLSMAVMVDRTDDRRWLVMMTRRRLMSKRRALCKSKSCSGHGDRERDGYSGEFSPTLAGRSIRDNL
jgi:hypothetical protein